MENISQMSLLEVAVALMEQKRTVQNVYTLITEVLEMKGLTDEDGSLTAQLYVDITTSSKFVYMGNDEWDLKIRQSLDMFDKDGSAFNQKDEDFDDEEIDDLEDSLDEDDLDDMDEDDMDEDDDSDSDEDDEDDDDSDDDIDFDDEDDDDSDDVYDDEDFEEDKYNEYMDDYEDMYEN